jgi:hypothetical protein
VLANVAQARGTEQGIDQRMQQDITVGVRDEPALVSHAHTTQHHEIARPEGVHVNP